MIKSRLAVLMAERGLKISDVYEDTGISKTTLMSISDNTGKGVQYDTVDKLCNYLGVSPCEFFEYSPYMIETSLTFLGDNELDGFTIAVKNQGYERDFYLDTTLFDAEPIHFPVDHEGYTGLLEVYVQDTDTYSVNDFYEILSNLTISFKTDIMKKIMIETKRIFQVALDKEMEVQMLSTDGKIDVKLKKGNVFLVRFFSGSKHEEIKRITL